MRIRRALPPLLALLLLFPVCGARADVAGTGAFDIDLALTPPNVPFNGDITFDAGTQTVLGQSVDLATDVGDMTFEGDAMVDVASQSATFDLSAESDGDFELTAPGAGSCENAGCVNGRGTFAGRLVTIIDPSNVLPDGVYTFDGTAQIDLSGQGPGGVFAINAFPRTPTPIGSDVEVSSGPQTFHDTVADAARNFLATARFANVSAAGDTEFVAFSALPGAFPDGVDLNAMVSVFVDVATNAMVTGGVRVCLGYPDANDDGIIDETINKISETRLRVLYATAIGTAFTDVTVSVADELACGVVPAVGPVALGVVAAGVTTTTVNPTSTSTSVPPLTTTSTTVPSGESTTTTIAVSPGGTTTTSTTLPVCATALECIDLAIAGPLCPGESLNQKLAAVILKKLTKAQTALLGARSASVAKKIAKLVGKARKQLDKIGSKADAFVSKPKGPISPECRDLIRAATALVTQQIEANRI